ncbi:MAG TPA: phosphoadenosine phosphosulfate reductase family protein [Pyrinomonadaceae bacterium]|jgi:3'-phosphoadenosine 5'-phosphosulfate sulfotransferase (PAPS reductase)/FAD synthetase
MSLNSAEKNSDSNIKVRHILNISGGKDSSALAIYMRDRDKWRERLGKPIKSPAERIEFEYVFCDTQEELKETYEYLDKLEAYLGKKIVRLAPERDFKHWLEVHGHFLPSPRMRWCTVQLKIKPFEKYVGDDLIYSYVGIRGDEDREGYISSKTNITPIFPFKEDGIDKNDVFRILEESGAGLPEYYKWRTRSGCYFCFFQRKAEWVGLMENHPELFEKAKAFEKVDGTTTRFTWTEGESLEELTNPQRVAQIKANHEKAMLAEKKSRPNRPLVDILNEVLDDEDDSQACNICHL